MRKTPLIALSALVLAMAGAQATTIPYKGFDRLANEADGIVVGTVRHVQPMMDARRDIATFVTFDELQVVGGRYAAPTLTLRLKGGVVGHEMLRVEGTPQFHEGERVLMFVQGNGRELVPFVGWTQGLFRLVPDGAGDFTVADNNGHAVLGVDGNNVRTAGGAEADLHVASAPAGADLVMHAAGATQAGGGRTDDGSAARMVDAHAANGAKPMSAQAFIAIARQRAAAHLATATPLRSVAIGQMPAAGDDRDAMPRNATEVVNQAVDSGAPARPQRAPAPAAGADLQ